jgi:hypothetical protein
LGENPCNDGSGKPIVATVPPRCAERLAAIGSGAISLYFPLDKSGIRRKMPIVVESIS